MYVSDGFTHDDDVMHEPSVTKTFLTACIWLKPFSTEVFASRPIRSVPISWLALPGNDVLTYDRIFLYPAASSISAADFDISCCMAFSLSLNSQSIVSVFRPHLSFLS